MARDGAVRERRVVGATTRPGSPSPGRRAGRRAGSARRRPRGRRGAAVENRNARDRTRSMYSRRATRDALATRLAAHRRGLRGRRHRRRRSRSGVRRSTRPRAARSRRPPPTRATRGGLLVGRPAHEVDEHLLERRVVDLEVRDARPGATAAASTASGSTPGSSSMSTAPCPGGSSARPERTPATAAGGRRRPADPDHPPTGGPLDLAERPADHEPAAVDDRDRLAQRLDHLHLVGGEDERSGRGRAAGGRPRGGARR